MGIFINHIWEKVNHRNENCLILIVGQPGSGKTFAALKLAEELDKTFTSEQIIFDLQKFYRVVNSDRFNKGSCLIIEEAGVSASSRNFWSEANKQLLNIIQTFRYKNFTCIFTVPDISFIDSGLRHLFHFIVVMKSKDLRKNETKGRLYKFANPGRRKGEAWTVFPRLKSKGKTVVIKNIVFGLPSKKLRDEYCELEAHFKHKIGLEAEGKFLEFLKKAAPVNPKLIIQDIKDKGIENYLHDRTYRGNRLADAEHIANEYGIGKTTASRIKRALDKEILKNTSSPLATTIKINNIAEKTEITS